LNRGRHLCSAGRPSRWALAHISSIIIIRFQQTASRGISASAELMTNTVCAGRQVRMKAERICHTATCYIRIIYKKTSPFACISFALLHADGTVYHFSPVNSSNAGISILQYIWTDFAIATSTQLFSLLSLWDLYYMRLEMWANAQRDGRPAEYRWRPLFNAAKFG